MAQKLRELMVLLSPACVILERNNAVRWFSVTLIPSDCDDDDEDRDNIDDRNQI